MSWNNIVGHERVKKILQHAIINQSIAGGYLFTGPEGIGKDALAVQFAKTCNCDSPVISEDSIDSCDECKSCRQFAKLAHSNLELIFSIPSGASDSKSDNPLEKLTKAQIEEIKSQTALKAENPYHKIKIEKASQIRISQVRQIKNKLARSGVSSKGRRFVVISRADEMTTEAANAFLKTLEEPNSNITVLMTTSRPELILQTILSRTQQINCPALPDYLIVESMIKQNDCDEAAARVAAALGQGSLTRAAESGEQGSSELREVPIELLRIAFKKNYYRTELLRKIEEISKYDKADTAKLLNLMIFWLRDATLLSRGANENRIINIDRIDVLKKFTSVYKDKDLLSGVKIVEDAVSLIPRNVNVRLILISMFIKLRAVFLYGKEGYEIGL